MAKAKRTSDYNGLFATRLRVCLDNKGITQNELAKSIGRTRQAVNFYTLGETVPDADTLKLIALSLNVSANYLIGLSDVSSRNATGEIATVQMIHSKTGLSEEAISVLMAGVSEKPLRIIDSIIKLMGDK